MKRINLPSDIGCDERLIIRCTPTRYRKKYTSVKSLARVLADRDVEYNDTKDLRSIYTVGQEKKQVALHAKHDKKVQTRAKKYEALLNEMKGLV